MILSTFYICSLIFAFSNDSRILINILFLFTEYSSHRSSEFIKYLLEEVLDSFKEAFNLITKRRLIKNGHLLNSTFITTCFDKAFVDVLFHLSVLFSKSSSKLDISCITINHSFHISLASLLILIRTLDNLLDSFIKDLLILREAILSSF